MISVQNARNIYGLLSRFFLLAAVGLPCWAVYNGRVQQEILHGAYDPDGVLADAIGISIRHVYMPWQAFDRLAFKSS